MIDRHFLGVQNALCRPIAVRLCAHGVTADTLTVIGFSFGIGSAVLISLKFYELALIPFFLNRVFDGLDGAVARLTKPTDRGAFLDIALDFSFYAMIPTAFALANPGSNALPASILLASFMGTASSFLAFAVIAAKRGTRSVEFPQKGIYYLGGLTEGAETIFAFTAMCIWPHFFPTIAIVFSILAAVTTVMRWSRGWITFSESGL